MPGRKSIPRPLAARDYVIEHELRPYCLIHSELAPEFADLNQTNPNAVVMGFEQVLASFNLETRDVLVVGDDIYGDIKGVRDAGLQSILVQSGKYRKDDELQLKPNPDVVQDVWQALQMIV